MNILIAGDFVPQYTVAEKLKNEEFEAVFPKNIVEIIKSNDFSIVNLESPIIDDIYVPIVKCGPNLYSTSIAAKALKHIGFNVVTLANNHILDYGCEALSETILHCKQQELNVVGGGRNWAKQLYVSANHKTLAIINCCEHEFSLATDRRAGANPLNPVRQYYAIREAREKADYVIVIVHGGHEHYQLPSPRMQETYHFFVDSGADAVINHHQHCYSGYEVYNGKPIFYGLGNFCFDDDVSRNSSWNEGYMVKLSLEKDNIGYDIIPYKQCDDEPGVHLLPETAFDETLKKLNDIIADKDKLMKAFESYCDSTSRGYELAASSYKNRVLRGLVSRGFIKQPLVEHLLTQLYDYIACESHRDRFLRAIEKLINKKLSK